MPLGTSGSNLKGIGKSPISQKMRAKNGEPNLVTLSLSGDGQQQGSGGSPDIFTFPIRPEQFTLDWPARQTVTQTINGAYQDHWGNGIGQIQIAGHTGWRQFGDKGEDGFKTFQKLRQMHDDYCQRCGDGDPSKVTLELTVAVPNGFGHYRVSSDRFRTLKSTQSPLLYRYEIQFTVIEDLGSQTGGQTTSTSDQSLFSNNIINSGSIVNSQSVLNTFTNQIGSVADSLLPQQTYQYVVQTGDSLASISQKLLGNSAYTTLILAHNPSITGDRDLATGSVLNIPILGSIT